MRLADVLQIVGAVLILSAYLLAQFRSLPNNSVIYMSLNALGAGILVVLAASSRLWGFLLLELVWAVAAVCALAAKAVRHWRAGCRLSDRTPDQCTRGPRAAKPPRDHHRNPA